MRRSLTKEFAISEGKKYKYRSDFKKSEPNLYKKVISNGWGEEVFSHMQHKPSIWTEEKCDEAAKQCKTKSEFSKNFSGAYSSAKKRGWLTNLSKKYFKPVGNKALRCIYAYEFSDKHVYVGLTFNLEKRDKQHMMSENSAVYQYIKKTGSKPVLIQLTDYIDSYEASDFEGYFLEKYVNDGWISINKTKTGGLGSSLEKKEKQLKENKKHWTKETIEEEAKKYKTRKEFVESSPSAYAVASRLKILDSVCKHMVLLQRKKWTKEEAQKEALKYKERGEFQMKSNGCYLVSSRNGWLDDICKHMINGYDRLKIYSKETVIETIKKYHRMQELRNSEDKFVRGCYWWLKKNKLLIEYKKYLKRD